jgi:hypothetical protein
MRTGVRAGTEIWERGAEEAVADSSRRRRALCVEEDSSRGRRGGFVEEEVGALRGGGFVEAAPRRIRGGDSGRFPFFVLRKREPGGFPHRRRQDERPDGRMSHETGVHLLLFLVVGDMARVTMVGYLSIVYCKNKGTICNKILYYCNLAKT